MSRGETFVKRNDVTGDLLMTKPVSDSYRDNYDKIFRKDKQAEANLDVAAEEAEELNERALATELLDEDDDSELSKDGVKIKKVKALTEEEENAEKKPRPRKPVATKKPAPKK